MAPILPSTNLDIPVIDISAYYSHDKTAIKRIARELHAACTSPGFLQVTGHQVPAELRSRLLAELPKFFALPAASKNAVHRSHSKCLRGYEQIGAQRLETAFADQKEGFMIGHELPEDAGFLRGPNQWPNASDLPEFRKAFTEYFNAVLELSRTLFVLLAISLDLPEDYFSTFVSSEDSIAMCRAHRYPPTTAEKAKASRGIGAHTDFGALTLLLQDDIGGLEVYDRPTDTWHAVRPIRDAYVVNIGDMLERWTNNKYQSTLHRVISPVADRDRYSVAFFNEGLGSQVIECIPSCLTDGERPLYEPVTAEDHLRKRYGSSY